MRRVLTPEQIAEAKQLRKEFGYTKRSLAKYYNVSETAVWQNVYANGKRVIVKTENLIKKRCSVCEVSIKKYLVYGKVPINYEIGDMCILCHLRKAGLDYVDVFGHYDV